MSKISTLQQRVDAAEQAFREVDEQHSSYNERLIELIDAVKSSLRQKLAEMTQNQMEYERMAQEFQQLSDMLRTLTSSVEAGGRARISHLMHELETAPAIEAAPAPAIEAAPAPAPAVETAPTPPASASAPRVSEPDTRPRADSTARQADDDLELMDYVDRESFRSGMQRVLKKKPRAASPKLTDLSDIPVT